MKIVQTFIDLKKNHYLENKIKFFVHLTTTNTKSFIIFVHINNNLHTSNISTDMYTIIF